MKTVSNQALAELYTDTDIYVMEDEPRVSFFQPPVMNTTPEKSMTLKQVHRLIVSGELKSITDKGRDLHKRWGNRPWTCAQGKENNPFRKHKASNFPYTTWSGVFRQRNDKSLVSESGLFCLNIDKLRPNQLHDKRQQAIEIDDDFFTTHLVYTSPSGRGLKWVVSVEPNSHSYKEIYEWLLDHVITTYGMKADSSTKDLSRVCFLCHDINAFYHE